MPGKHAYMIMAHTEFELLEKLVGLLDHERHEIYLHVDAKARGFDEQRIRAAAGRSSVVLVPRLDIGWGAFSQVECELALLEAAIQSPHDYYHLISGMDLPLHDAESMLRFFDDRLGSEYVNLSTQEGERLVRPRVSLFHPFQERLGRSRSPLANWLTRLAYRIALRGQRLAGVDRLRSASFQLKYGSQWFSITDPLARHVVAQAQWVRTTFRATHCADELFLQTVAHSSVFRDRLVGENLRLVDWSRGDGRHPHVWRYEDADTLLGSDCLFARKFDTRVDSAIVDVVCARVRGEEHSARRAGE